ncbi:AraC family transcriptional regulator [Chitinophaga filiformis]|uniref:helix-turn-helix domain-containing protein n=1 Tax=Chitinophaga filiformis TaxID=104663 RepID=UPI001F3CF4FA|nr:helix-turn-helix domain-containing protein [Chitinophaga filiformis]MCF6404992.1 AraC family transcriptional regulator [Chitinophaga filiformis]
MKRLCSSSNETLLSLNTDPDCLASPAQFSEYTVVFIPEGEGLYHADFGTFPFKGPVLLFSTPLQLIYIERSQPCDLTMLQFHSDFYCIEYHKAQVACNGLLFNNIYITPSVNLDERETASFKNLLAELTAEFDTSGCDEIVMRGYLQLLLAKSSSIKLKSVANKQDPREKDEQMEEFRELLEQHYLTLHKPSDYAEMLAMSPNNFTKRCTRYFKKSPSAMIQERLILEAKKQLHLTRRSIKEIAYALQFSDEFYFSRFFKKFTKVSPQTFRQKTGISIVADLPK